MQGVPPRPEGCRLRQEARAAVGLLVRAALLQLGEMGIWVVPAREARLQPVVRSAQGARLPARVRRLRAVPRLPEEIRQAVAQLLRAARQQAELRPEAALGLPAEASPMEVHRLRVVTRLPVAQQGRLAPVVLSRASSVRRASLRPR